MDSRIVELETLFYALLKSRQRKLRDDNSDPLTKHFKTWRMNMHVIFQIKRLFTVVLIGGIGCAALAGPIHGSDLPPKASHEEAKIKHWNMPQLKQSFWDISELDKAYITAKPTDRSDGLRTGTLGEDSGNKKTIIKLAKEIADKQHGEVDSLLIAHKGKVLFESYYSRGRVDLSHPQSSTTKSYTSLAVGRAIQLGYLSMADLDKPVTSFLHGLDITTFVEGVDKITLNKALSMSSGLQIPEETLEEYRKHPERYKGIKQIQAYFEDSAPITEASQTFNYQGANPDIVMHVLDVVVPGSAELFIKRELLSKLGIVNFDWRKDASSGLLASGANSSVTSRDMVKIGTLVMNKGAWNGEQLIPEAYIAKSTSKNVQLSSEQVKNFYSGESLSNSGYGYFWWQTDMQVDDRLYTANSAQGGGGVTILSIDELDLLVVVTAHSRQAYLQMIAEKVVPAFI